MNTLEFHESLPTIRQLTGLLAKEAMKRTQGNLDRAAALIGISREKMMQVLMQEFNRL